MNPVRLQQVLLELQAQKAKLWDHYQQTLGAETIIAKILKEFPQIKEAETNLLKDS